MEYNYNTVEEYNRLIELNNEVGRLLTYMMNNPDKFGVAPI